MVGARHGVAAGAGAPAGAPSLQPGGGRWWQRTGGLSDARVMGGIGGPSARGTLRSYPWECVWLQLRRLSLATTHGPRPRLPPTHPWGTCPRRRPPRFALYRPRGRRRGRGDRREPRHVAGRRTRARHPRRCLVRCRHGHRRGLCRRRTCLPVAAPGCGRRHPPSAGSFPASRTRSDGPPVATPRGCPRTAAGASRGGSGSVAAAAVGAPRASVWDGFSLRRPRFSLPHPRCRPLLAGLTSMAQVDPPVVFSALARRGQHGRSKTASIVVRLSRLVSHNICRVNPGAQPLAEFHDSTQSGWNARINF
ncbi:hypothetical protein BU14_0303s0007 [Porphyra umbilicalis]|uniref:Uncharacterized protein n=1 Tax=Porphyra umbilicalis TaxID=2786 RepID=A0A1X6P070_PORUM|nr:hypothetical protein BU14_0303s0007 [Porphyra umbilicalis]|eukprot:OSX74175.1 hypothetical protein BU14_0303s0007 [Porphyra umbilicalis]